MMRRTLIVVLLLVGLSGLSLVPASEASAVDVLNVCSESATTVGQRQNCSDCRTSIGKQTAYCQDAAAQTSQNPAVHFITIIINIVSFIGGAAAVISLIVCGLRIMLANGDANNVATARSGIIYAIVGLVVIALAQSIVIFVLNRIK